MVTFEEEEDAPISFMRSHNHQDLKLKTGSSLFRLRWTVVLALRLTLAALLSIDYLKH